MLEVGIPVYNAEATLPKALDSLVAQTKNNFICCLSIDGDGKYEYYKELAHEYIRRGLKMRIINSEENGGPGMARKRVLDTTQCDYIMFLDADDMFMPRAVEVLYTQAKTGNYDIIRSSFIREEKNKSDQLLPQNIATITWFHGKIYKVAYLKEKGIDFLPGLWTDEDAYFNLIAWNSTANRGELSEATYLWRFNENSLTRAQSTKDYFLRTYLYYIRSQVEGLKRLYEINNTINLFLAGQTLLNIYYYYMRARLYGVDETLMDNIIASLKTQPWIPNFFMDGDNWSKLSPNIKQSQIFDGIVVFFPETFNIWVQRLLT